MSFMKPKVPKAAPPPNPSITAIDAGTPEEELSPSSFSLISTAARGLRRRAEVERTSLIGGV